MEASKDVLAASTMGRRSFTFETPANSRADLDEGADTSGSYYGRSSSSSEGFFPRT